MVTVVRPRPLGSTSPVREPLEGTLRASGSVVPVGAPLLGGAVGFALAALRADATLDRERPMGSSVAAFGAEDAIAGNEEMKPEGTTDGSETMPLETSPGPTEIPIVMPAEGPEMMGAGADEAAPDGALRTTQAPPWQTSPAMQIVVA